VPRHVRELRRYLDSDLVPHHHGMALRVALGHDCQKPDPDPAGHHQSAAPCLRPGAGLGDRAMTRAGVQRIIRYAFKLAQSRPRKMRGASSGKLTDRTAILRLLRSNSLLTSCASGAEPKPS